MRKHLSLIGVLLVSVVFHLGPKVEAEIDPYISPALLLGMTYDFGGDDGLELYPFLSAKVTGGMAFDEVL